MSEAWKSLGIARTLCCAASPSHHATALSEAFRANRSTAHRFLTALVFGWSAICAPCAAAPNISQRQPSAASQAKAENLTATVTIEDSTLSVPAVLAEIAGELGATIHPTTMAEASDRHLVISIRGHKASITFTEPQGHSVGRTIELPEDESLAMETMALLASNLVRNEAAELLEELARKAEAARSTAELTESDDEELDSLPAPELSGDGEQPAEGATEGKPQPLEGRPTPPPAEASKPAPPAGNVAPKLIDTELNLSLWHPIALYPDSHLRRFHIELGFAYSRIGALDGLLATLGVAKVDHGARGLAVSIFGSWVDGDSSGLIGSGLAHFGTGKFVGVQATGIVALQLGPNADSGWGDFVQGAHFEGFQAGGLVNYVAGDMFGVQSTGALNTVTGQLKGVQASTVNLVGEGFDGIQFGVVNLDWFKRAADGSVSRGVQAGIVDAAASDFEGAQVGAANTVAGRFNGAQFGVANIVSADSNSTQVGVVNISSDQTGAQVGLLNVARDHRGVQIGLVNVNRKTTGIFIGLLTFAENVDTSVLTYASSLTPLNLGVKSAAPWYFMRASLGYHPAAEWNGENVSAGRAAMALGSHLELNQHWALDPGMEYSSVFRADGTSEAPRQYLGPELSVEYKPSRWFGCFAGGALRLQGSDEWAPTAEIFGGLEVL